LTFGAESGKIMIVFQEVNIMKFLILIMGIFLCCAAAANADYDYIIEDGYASLTLNDYETLLMTGGGGTILTFFITAQQQLKGQTR